MITASLSSHDRAAHLSFTMPEFVYALHDFLPENVDEISFKAGDRIEVIEKDDNFGDGWWQVRPRGLLIPHALAQLSPQTG